MPVPVTVKVPEAAIFAVVVKVDPEAIVRVVQEMAVAVDCAPAPLKLTVVLVNVYMVLEYWVAKAPIMVTSIVPVPVKVPLVTV